MRLVQRVGWKILKNVCLFITLHLSLFSLTLATEARVLEGSQGVLFLWSQVSKEVASEFGELVADPKTGELLHYAEKPETFVMSWPPVFNFLILLVLNIFYLKSTFFTTLVEIVNSII